MFSRFTSFLSQAAEITAQVCLRECYLACRPTEQGEEFQAHWKTITTLLMTEGNEKEGDISAATEILTHLTRMGDLLATEDDETQGTMGPCVEYLLRHKLLDTLFATGKEDYPPGMRAIILQFLSILLGRLQQSLLPHVAVHRPVNQLVSTCGLMYDNPLVADELQFLRTLCLKLKKDATLANFFLENVESEKKFSLTEALMRLTNSEESLMSLKAFECLLLCVSHVDANVAMIVAASQFPLMLASRMRQHLQLLHPSLHWSEVLNCKSGWGVNYASSSAIQCISPAPHQPLLHLEAYFSWMDYCEQVIEAAPKSLSEVLCATILEQVLQGILLPKLCDSSEADFVIGIAVATQSIRLLSPNGLLAQEYVRFLLTNVCGRIIKCCNHLNEDICSATMILVSTLFKLPTLPNFLPSISHKKDDGIKNPKMFKAELETVVKSYLSIIPTNLLSAPAIGGDSGLTDYLLEAHQQVNECRRLSEKWSEEKWRLAEISSGDSERWEGSSPLVESLLDRLEKLLDQNYELNLHLTSVITLLACYSHPLLDEQIFGTRTLPDLPDSSQRTVYSVLRKVSAQLQKHADRSPGLSMNIVEARRRLLGQETSDLLSMPHNELLEGAVVLEEFCKELAAVLYVKNSNLLLTSPSSLTHKESNSSDKEC